MNKQNNKDKIFDAIIKICLAILIYTICKFAFDNLFTDNFTIFDERIDKYEEYIKDNDDKNIKYMLNYNVNGEMTLYTLEDYVNLVIYDYDDIYDDLDEIFRDKFSSELIVTVSHLQDIIYDDGRFCILKDDGNLEYTNKIPLSKITVDDVINNSEFFNKNGFIFDEFFYYNDEFIYKRRPDFSYYENEYNGGNFNKEMTLEEAGVKYKYYSYLKNTYTDESTIPTDDESLEKYLENSGVEYSKDVGFKDIVKLNRFCLDFYDKDTALAIISYIKEGNFDTSSAPMYIYSVKEKMYDKDNNKAE